jgi:hypothetical protein
MNSTNPTTGRLAGHRLDVAAAAGDVLAQLADVADHPVVTGRPVAQGDLLVLPWPRTVAPVERAAAWRATRPVPTGGVDVLPGGRHILLADGPHVTWGGQRSASGLTLGTLVVGDDSVAQLSHLEHDDLFIGRGVYVIRCTRNAVAPSPAAAPQAQPDWREAID